MSRVSLDPDHLDQLAASLRDYAATTERLVARARGLGAGADVAGLAGAPAWAHATAGDLRRRAGLVRATEARRLGGLGSLGLSPLHPAARAGASPLAPGADPFPSVAELLQSWAPPLAYGRLPHEPLEDWVTRLVGESVGHYTDLPGDPVTEALRLLQDGTAILGALAMSGLASTSLAKHAVAALAVAEVAGTIDRDVPLLRLVGLPEGWRLRAGGWLHGFGKVRAPGTLPAFLTSPWERVSHLPPGQFSSTMEGEALKRLNDRSAALRRWLGQGWTDPRDIARLQALRPPSMLPTEFERLLANPRGSTNLVSVLRQTTLVDGRPATYAQRLTAVTSTAGRLRGLGIAGQAVATGLSAHKLLDKDHGKAWRDDKADYLSDVAETAFNGSLTAMMVAPTPWTAGAVAVTGIVYAGSEVWDHWDGIKAWTTDGGPERAVAAARDVGQDGLEAAGKALDAIKKIDLNPF